METEFTPVLESEQLDYDDDGSEDTDAITVNGDDTEDLAYYRGRHGLIMPPPEYV
jgi:hypothetical protein